jgi:hypothetical protein
MPRLCESSSIVCQSCSTQKTGLAPDHHYRNVSRRRQRRQDDEVLSDRRTDAEHAMRSSRSDSDDISLQNAVEGSGRLVKAGAE